MSLSEQEILGGGGICFPSVEKYFEHQGMVSTSCTLIQVSKIPAPNVNGKVQLSQPVGGGGYVGGSDVAFQTARNLYDGL